MNASEHQHFIEAVRAHHTIVGVDQVFAKKLYTIIPMDTMERTIGEVPYFEKRMVCCALFASPVALISGIALFALGLHWWVLVIAPAFRPDQLVLLCWSRAIPCFSGASVQA